jgi:hopanoid biosynthesis associated RND transporter like protein HpnN
MIDIQNRLLQLVSRLVFNHACIVIAVFSFLAILGALYTAQNLGVNSDTSAMFDERLSFRQIRENYKNTFPKTEDNMVVVVSGTVPELVNSVADSIATELRQRPDLFEAVFQPTGEPFMKQNQLLYLDTADLTALTANLVKAKPMMSFLSEHYSLKGLFSFLGLMVRYSSPDQLEGMVPVFQKMDTVLMATLNGHRQVMSWQNLMGSEVNLTPMGYSFIQVKPVLDFEKIRPAKTAIQEAQSIAQQYEDINVKVRLTGKKAMTYEEMGSVMDGAIQASILALIMVSLVLWIGLRSFRLIVATLYTLMVGLVLTAAFSTWAVGQLNMISVAFAVLYIGLGVDYAIHVCLRYRELAGEGFPIRESLATSINHIAPALILSTLSTSIGFYAFVPTAFTGVRELGIIAGTGMFISLLVTLLLLPCLLLKLSAIGTASPRAERSIGGPIIERYRKPIRIGTVVVVVVALVLLPQIKFDYDPINLRDPNSQSVSTIRELMSEKSFTPWSLNIISLDSSTSKELKQQLQKLPEVDRSLDIFSFIPRDQQTKIRQINQVKNKLEGLDAPAFVFEQIPDQQQVTAIGDFAALLTSPAYAEEAAMASFGQHLSMLVDSLDRRDTVQISQTIEALQSGLLKALPYTMSSALGSLDPSQISLSSLPDNLKERWISREGQFRIQAMPAEDLQNNDQMKRFASAVQQVAPEATGDLMVTIASADTVVKSFKQAILYALIAITTLLLIYLRDLKETLFILVPLFLAGIFTCAFTVVSGIEFNFANIIALPLLLGLGVDNGVHIVHRAKSDTSGKGLLQTSTARAVLFSSLTTLLSFGNLAFSPHRGTASMGWLLTIGVFFVVVSTLVVLPAFLSYRRPAVKD